MPASWSRPTAQLKTLEFNCRFGDPETQVVLPLLETDLVDILLGVTDAHLDEVEVTLEAAERRLRRPRLRRLPRPLRQGPARLTGLEQVAHLSDVAVFHAGTALDDDGQVVTDGGRVLGVTGLGDDFAQARARAYAAVKNIHFERDALPDGHRGEECVVQQVQPTIRLLTDRGDYPMCLLQTLGLTALFLSITAHTAWADARDLPNFHTVAPGIYRSAAPTPAGLKRLHAMGVRTIIDLRYSPVRQEKAEARALGFHWINLPMGSDPPTPRQVSTLIATLKRAPQEPVLVHCQHGADRTGCMIGIWRVTQQGWTFPQAWAEMRHDGFDPRWRHLTEAVRQRAH